MREFGELWREKFTLAPCPDLSISLKWPEPVRLKFASNSVCNHYSQKQIGFARNDYKNDNFQNERQISIK